MSKIYGKLLNCCFVGRHLALIQLIWSNEYPTLKKESVCVPRIFKQRPLHHPLLEERLLQGAILCNYCEGTRVTDTHHLLRISCCFFPRFFLHKKKPTDFFVPLVWIFFRSGGNWSLTLLPLGGTRQIFPIVAFHHCKVKKVAVSWLVLILHRVHVWHIHLHSP